MRSQEGHKDARVLCSGYESECHKMFQCSKYVYHLVDVEPC